MRSTTSLHEHILVYGAGGHTKTVLATIEDEGRYEVLGLLDDDRSRHGSTFYGYPVLGGAEQLAPLRTRGLRWALVAVGDNFRRAGLARLLQEHGFELVSTVHPSAVVLRGASVGAGTVVLAHALVGSDALVGTGCIVSIGAIVGHDCTVGAWAQLCPKASLAGGAQVGDFAFIGTGACILQQVKVGREVVVGANAVVRDDLPDGVTAVGLPARIVKQRGESQ